MWEPAVSQNPPATHPWGIRQPPPRLPPAPPGTAGAVPDFGRPEPQPYTLQGALRECMLHARSIRLFLWSADKLRRSAPHLPPEIWDHYLATMPEVWDGKLAALRGSFDYALLRLLRWPERSPDADHPATKTRLLHAIREGAHLSLLLELLQQRNMIGEVITPPADMTVGQIPHPAHCPEWALHLLPPRSVVRWVTEDLDRALDTAENYESLERFDAKIAFPLAALTAALPRVKNTSPYGPDR